MPADGRHARPAAAAVGLAQAITTTRRAMPPTRSGHPVAPPRRRAARSGDARPRAALRRVRRRARRPGRRLRRRRAGCWRLHQQSGGVARVLRQLADGVARDVRARRDIEAERAEARQSMRMLLLIQAGVLGLLALVPGFAAPYRDPARADWSWRCCWPARWRCWCGCAASPWATGRRGSSPQRPQHRPQRRPDCRPECRAQRRPECREFAVSPLLMLLLAAGALIGTGSPSPPPGSPTATLAGRCVGRPRRTDPARRGRRRCSPWTAAGAPAARHGSRPRPGGARLEPRPLPGDPGQHRPRLRRGRAGARGDAAGGARRRAAARRAGRVHPGRRAGRVDRVRPPGPRPGRGRPRGAAATRWWPTCSRSGCCAAAAPGWPPRCRCRPSCWPTAGRCGGSPTSSSRRRTRRADAVGRAAPVRRADRVSDELDRPVRHRRHRRPGRRRGDRHRCSPAPKASTTNCSPTNTPPPTAPADR